MNIYVGNLSWSINDSTLRAAFAPHGEVSSASVIIDKMSGRSRGFGFVEMPNAAEAKAAISAMNGADLDGRTLTVNEARPKEDRGGNRGNKSSYGNRDRRDSNW
ncbi:MAG: RNA-binding protein [Caldilineales bacterium]|nr:RNA-binding protein [Caldilineales bacterium]